MASAFFRDYKGSQFRGAELASPSFVDQCGGGRLVNRENGEQLTTSAGGRLVCASSVDGHDGDVLRRHRVPLKRRLRDPAADRALVRTPAVRRFIALKPHTTRRCRPKTDWCSSPRSATTHRSPNPAGQDPHQVNPNTNVTIEMISTPSQNCIRGGLSLRGHSHQGACGLGSRAEPTIRSGRIPRRQRRGLGRQAGHSHDRYADRLRLRQYAKACEQEYHSERQRSNGGCRQSALTPSRPGAREQEGYLLTSRFPSFDRPAQGLHGLPCSSAKRASRTWRYHPGIWPPWRVAVITPVSGDGDDRHYRQGGDAELGFAVTTSAGQQHDLDPATVGAVGFPKPAARVAVRRSFWPAALPGHHSAPDPKLRQTLADIGVVCKESGASQFSAACCLPGRWALC